MDHNFPTPYTTREFPPSRIATIDVCELGKQKHHVTGLIELDVTGSRKMIRDYNRNKNERISFIAWIIHVIASTIKEHETAAAYRKGKKKLFIFEDINVSIVVEKVLEDQRVPIPLIIAKADKISIESITGQIHRARNEPLGDHGMVLHRKTSQLEKVYHHFPGFMRRFFWRYLLRHPKMAFSRMGNVAITSLGMMGQMKGWFIPLSVHPVCFGLGSVVKKPVVINEQVAIREILSMSVLIDHDVIDGAPVARFIKDLAERIEHGYGLDVR